MGSKVKVPSEDRAKTYLRIGENLSKISPTNMFNQKKGSRFRKAPAKASVKGTWASYFFGN